MGRPWRMFVVAGVVLAIAASAGAAEARSGHPGTGRGDVARVPATAVLDWNAAAVATVRGAVPAKFQLESDLYMAYVQASVYDAVVKIAGRYEPYHDFASPASRRGASVPAAVAAAAYTALAYYFPSQQATLQATYTGYLAGLASDGQAAGVAIGQAAANDIITERSGDGRDAVISTPYGAGPLTAGVWVFAPRPSLQSAQTPWLAFMRPFLLRAPWQFRVGPPPSLTSSRYTRDLNEVQAYGSATSTLRTAEQTAVAQFWNAFATNQTNTMITSVVSTHAICCSPSGSVGLGGENLESSFGQKIGPWGDRSSIHRVHVPGPPRTAASTARHRVGAGCSYLGANQPPKRGRKAHLSRRHMPEARRKGT